jgi:hypothetical protein
MASYNYEQIGDSERCIRILTLSSGREEDLLCGQLDKCPLDEISPYDALSYCWGTGVKDAVIDCSGGSIQITKTLDRALRVLRHKDKTRRLWIDQICINQENNADRSSQVRLMYDIYSCAQRTVVWLGGDEHDLGPVVRNLFIDFEAMGAVCRRHGYSTTTPPNAMSLLELSHLTDEQFKEKESDGELIVNHESRWFPTDDVLRKCPLPDRSSEAWPAFNALLESVYFTRVWTLQEVLSSREAVILWGTTELPWAKLRGAYHWAILNHCMVKDLRQDIHSPALKRVKFLELEISWFRGMRFQNLADLVIICREGFEATNPRDQIYAFTSLASDGRNFEINYDKSEAEVFADFSRCYLRSGDLTMLNLAGLYGAEGPRLPSWVASWRSRLFYWRSAGRDSLSSANLDRPVYPLAGGGPGGSLQDRRSDGSSASDINTIKVEPDGSDKILVKGFRLDQAEIVCSRPAYSNQGSHCVHIVSQYNELFRACASPSTALRAMVDCMTSANRAAYSDRNELLAQFISFIFNSMVSSSQEYVASLDHFTPEESMPEDSGSEESVSEESASERPASKESAPAGSVPEEPHSEESASEASESEESLPNESAPEVSATARSDSEGSESEEAEPKESAPEESASDASGSEGSGSGISTAKDLHGVELIYLAANMIDSGATLTNSAFSRLPMDAQEMIKAAIRQLHSKQMKKKKLNAAIKGVADNWDVQRTGQFQGSFAMTATGRKLFVTTDGPMGIGPASMSTTDIIAIVYGAETPYVLRPVPGTEEYLLLGDCYIHGLMYGKATPSEKHPAAQWFPLVREPDPTTGTSMALSGGEGAEAIDQQGDLGGTQGVI